MSGTVAPRTAAVDDYIKAIYAVYERGEGPASTTALTVLTWLPFMAFVALIERPWDTSLGYDALQERIYQPQPIPPEYVTAGFRDARKHLPHFSVYSANRNSKHWLNSQKTVGLKNAL